MEERPCFVYIMTNKGNRVLCTGITNDLKRRVYEHKLKFVKGFTERYNVDKLVYYEASQSIDSAISGDKQIKGGSRRKKVGLVNSMNAEWKDLYEGL
jgi:putative endonuclease